MFSKLENAVKEKNQFNITILTLAELLKRAFLSNRKEESLNLIENFVKNINVFSLDKESCKIYGEKQNFKKKDKKRKK